MNLYFRKLFFLFLIIYSNFSKSLEVDIACKIVATKDLEIIDKLLAGGWDINIPLGSNMPGNTILKIAIESEQWDLEFSQQLVDKGADVNLAKINGEELIFSVLERNQLERLKFLIKNNANLLIKNNKGQYVFEIAQKLVNDKLTELDVLLRETLKLLKGNDLNFLLYDPDPDQFELKLSEYYTAKKFLDCLENHFLHR